MAGWLEQVAFILYTKFCVLISLFYACLNPPILFVLFNLLFFFFLPYFFSFGVMFSFQGRQLYSIELSRVVGSVVRSDCSTVHLVDAPPSP